MHPDKGSSEMHGLNCADRERCHDGSMERNGLATPSEPAVGTPYAAQMIGCWRDRNPVARWRTGPSATEEHINAVSHRQHQLAHDTVELKRCQAEEPVLGSHKPMVVRSSIAIAYVS